MKFYRSFYLAALPVGAPLAAAAQASPQYEDLTKPGTPLAPVAKLVFSIGGIVDLLIPLVLGIALLSFFWGMAKFIGSAGSAEGRAKGRRLMLSAILALTVMVSIWGIVGFIQESLSIGGVQKISIPEATTPSIPTVPSTRSSNS